MEDLFSSGYLRESEPLYIVDGINKKVLDVSWEELLDYKKYDSLFAVTYVSSPQLIKRLMRGFANCKVLLGIDSYRNLASIRDRLGEKQVKLFNSMTDEQRDCLVGGAYGIHYTREHPIHSKLYLLKSSSSNESRIIIGSANATANATVKRNNKKQFEELVVFDNCPELYEIWFSRFEHLWQFESLNYISEYLLKKWELDRNLICIDDIDELTINIANDVNNPEVQDMLVLSAEEYKNLKRRILEGDSVVSQQDKDAVALYSAIINPSTLTLKNPSKMKSEVKQVYERCLPKILDRDSSTETLSQYWFAREDPSINRQYLFVGSWPIYNDETEAPQQGSLLFSNNITENDLKREIRAIHSLVESYGTYTVHPVSTQYRKRIYDSLIYVLTSPLLCDIRQIIKEGDQKSTLFQRIPLYLILGGTAHCGKSSLLKFMYSMLCGDNIDTTIIDYDALKKSRRFGGLALEDAFSFGNRFPLFVDEFDLSLFNNKNYVRKFKACANTTTLDSLDGYAPLICTGNAASFRPHPELETRVRYDEFNAPFPKIYATALRSSFYGEEYFNAIREDMQGNLAKYFLEQLSILIAEEDLNSYQLREDPWYLSRGILLALYENLGIEVPDYFPFQKIENSITQSQVQLALAYRDRRNRDAITYMNKDQIIKINLLRLSDGQNKKDVESLRLSVPTELLVSGLQQQRYLIVHARPFLIWLDKVLGSNKEGLTIPEKLKEWKIKAF